MVDPIATPPIDLVWTRSIDYQADDRRLLSQSIQVHRRAASMPETSADRRAIRMMFRPSVSQLPCSSPPPDKIAAVESAALCVITSTATVRYLAGTPALLRSLSAHQGVITFGEATAEALTTSGISARRVPVATGDALAEWIKQNHRASDAVMILGATQPATPYEQILGRAGFDVQSLHLYKTQSRITREDGAPYTDHDRAQDIGALSGVVCFASPSAVAGFCDRLTPEANRLGTALVAVCIGETTAPKARAYFRRVEVTPTPSIEALATLAVRICLEVIS